MGRATPTFLDRALAWFSPERGVRRLQARMYSALLAEQAASFDAGKYGKRTKGWRAHMTSPNSAAGPYLSRLVARSRDLVRNAPYARSAVQKIASNTVGTGLRTKIRLKDERRRAEALALWQAWSGTPECDSGGLLDLPGIQDLTMQEVPEAGEFLIRRRWRRSTDQLAVPMQLELLEAEFLDITKDEELSGGRRIVQGVEFDELGRRVAYWLHREHPGEVGGLRGFQDPIRVRARDVIHVLRVERAGQVRGVPWGASCALRLKDLDDYFDAQLLRQKIAACFTGFVKTPSPDSMPSPTGAEGEESTAVSTPGLSSRILPGALQHLPPGWDIELSKPPGVDSIQEYSAQTLREIAAGFGVSYEVLSGDYSQLNFSSGRMGWIEFHRNVTRWQRLMVIPQLCQRIWLWFLEAAIVAGKLPDEPIPVSWTPPRREMIDPVKETAAMKLAIRNGLMTVSEALMMLGQDPEEALEDRSSDDGLLDSLSIILDCDPRQDVSRLRLERERERAAAGAGEESEEEKEPAAVG